MAVIMVQGSRARLVSGGLVSKVDNPDQWKEAGVPVVPVTADDIDRVTTVGSNVDINTVPEGVGGQSVDISSTSRFAGLLVLGFLIVFLGVSLGLVAADQFLNG